VNAKDSARAVVAQARQDARDQYLRDMMSVQSSHPPHVVYAYQQQQLRLQQKLSSLPEGRSAAAMLRSDVCPYPLPSTPLTVTESTTGTIVPDDASASALAAPAPVNVAPAEAVPAPASSAEVAPSSIVSTNSPPSLT